LILYTKPHYKIQDKETPKLPELINNKEKYKIEIILNYRKKKKNTKLCKMKRILIQR